MGPRTAVAIVANEGRTLSGFCRTASLAEASRDLDAAAARLWAMGQAEGPSVIVSVGDVSAEYASVWQTERALASMFHEQAQASDPKCPAVALWDALAVAHAPG